MNKTAPKSYQIVNKTYNIMHISTACPGGTPPGHPGTLKKHDSNALIPPFSPGKCVSQTAIPLGLRIK
jgi:hypothetical protein